MRKVLIKNGWNVNTHFCSLKSKNFRSLFRGCIDPWRQIKQPGVIVIFVVSVNRIVDKCFKIVVAALFNEFSLESVLWSTLPESLDEISYLLRELSEWKNWYVLQEGLNEDAARGEGHESRDDKKDKRRKTVTE